MSNFKVVVVTPEKTNVLKDGLTKKEAEEMAEDWRITVFNSDAFYDPVPKVVVLAEGTEE